MKVWPASDELRKVLRHPVGGAFRDSGSGDWPDDTYTYRRLREGSILLVDPFASAPSPTPTIVAPTPVVSPDLTKEETEKLRQAWEKEQAPLEKFQEFVEPQKPVAPKATLKELEAILDNPDPPNVRVNPDGSVTEVKPVAPKKKAATSKEK